jgi:hypothetical protein
VVHIITTGLYRIKDKEWVYEITTVCLCVCVSPFNVLTSYPIFMESGIKIVPFKVIATWTHELVRWERHIIQGPEVIYDNRSLKNIQFPRAIFI